MMGDILAVIAVCVVLAAAAGWAYGRRYRPTHRRDPITPRHMAVSVPRLGSMILDAELQVRGSDDDTARPAGDLPWLQAGTVGDVGDVAATLSAWLDGEAAGDPECTRLLRTTGEVLRGKLLAEVVSELDRQDRDTAEFLSLMAAQVALARLHVLENWA